MSDFDAPLEPTPMPPAAEEVLTGVEVIGRVIYLGMADAMDAGGARLEITHASPEGFWGRWHEDMGIAMVLDTATGKRLRDPAGYFCAIRER